MGTTTRKGVQAAVMATAMVGAAVALPVGQAHAASGGTVTANFAFIYVTAAEGKANQITISPSGSTIVISDAGDTVTAGTGCTQRTANSVICAAGVRARPSTRGTSTTR